MGSRVCSLRYLLIARANNSGLSALLREDISELTETGLRRAVFGLARQMGSLGLSRSEFTWFVKQGRF